MTRWVLLVGIFGALCGCPLVSHMTTPSTNETMEAESSVVVCGSVPTALPPPPVSCFNPTDIPIYVGGPNVDGTNGWALFDSPTRYGVKLEARAWCKARTATPLVCVRGVSP